MLVEPNISSTDLSYVFTVIFSIKKHDFFTNSPAFLKKGSVSPVIYIYKYLPAGLELNAHPLLKGVKNCHILKISYTIFN